jgi:hypothetical protein
MQVWYLQVPTKESNKKNWEIWGTWKSKTLKIGKEGGSLENKSWKGKFEHVAIQLI